MLDHRGAATPSAAAATTATNAATAATATTAAAATTANVMMDVDALVPIDVMGMARIRLLVGQLHRYFRFPAHTNKQASGIAAAIQAPTAHPPPEISTN